MDQTRLPDDGSTRTDGLDDRYLKPGSCVTHYRIIELIGGGGMGVLYRAHDTALGRTVALKCPWPEVAAKPLSVKRFLREARTAAGLSHPHIVAVHEVFEHDGLPWLAMEYVRGKDLSGVLSEKRSLPIRDVLRWGEQIAHALDAAHSSGVLHRDIKPANILISDAGNALLTDFGLARHLPQQPAGSQVPTVTQTLTMQGATVGTPGYWSPEQAQGASLDERSDVFSLGAVLFEMCTGRRLSAVDSIYSSHGSSQVLQSRTIRRINRSVPTSVETIVRRAVALNPDDRYASVAELANDLRQSREEWEAKRFLTGIHRKRPGAFVTAVVLLLFLAAVVIWDRARRPPPNGRHPAQEVTSTALVTWPSFEADARFSPDRLWVSFISNRDGAFRVWVKSLDAQLEEAVTPREGAASSHVWSPDGREIASLVYVASGAFIRIGPALGGPPRKSIPLDPEFSGPILNRWIGTRIYVDGGRSLHAIDTHTGESVELLGPAESGYRGQFDVRPDGKRVAYTAGQGPQLAIWTSDLDGTSARQVTSGKSNDNGARWVGPDWDSIFFSSTRTGQLDLWRVYLKSGFTTRITLSAGVERLTDVAADGSLLAFEQSSQFVHLWTMKAGGKSPHQLSAGTLSDFWPSVAADAAVIAFQRTKPTLDNLASYFGGQILLGRLGASGTLETELAAEDGQLPRLSADARWLAYARASELWIRELATGHGIRVTDRLSLPGVSEYPLASARDTFAWSGSVLYYAERTPETGGARRVRTDDLEQSETVIPEQSETAVLGLSPSADGRRLAYVVGRRGSQELRCLELVSGADRPLMSVADSSLFTPGWLADDRSLLVLRAGAALGTGTLEVLVADLSGKARAIGEIEGGYFETASLGAAGESFHITAERDGLHNIFAFSLADGSLRQITDNALPGVTFSKLHRWTADRLLYARQQRNTDIWTIEFSEQRQD